jgi:mannonate dehydratase
VPRLANPDKGYYEFSELMAAKSKIESYGLRFECFNILPWRMCYKWMLGLPGRDEQIEQLQKTIRNMGAVGIPLLLYNMHAMRFYRTSWHTFERGGAVATSFNIDMVKNAPLMAGGPDADPSLIPESHRRPITDAEMWDNLTYFLKAMVPVAEESGVKLCLHPDDPPIPSIGGVARIMREPEAFKRAMEIVPSDNSGLKFCVGCFSEMGADIVELIEYFGERNKILYVDFRNVRGTAESFVETFPDDGKDNLFDVMKALYDVGFGGPVSADHALHIVGDTQFGHRYWAYAIGHMRGLLQAIKSDQS